MQVNTLLWCNCELDPDFVIKDIKKIILSSSNFFKRLRNENKQKTFLKNVLWKMHNLFRVVRILSVLFEWHKKWIVKKQV